MRKLEEIRKLLTHYKENLYSGVRFEQGKDLGFYEDTFEVPEVKDPHIALRTGVGRRMIDAPAEQIITSNPQAFVHTNKKYSEKKPFYILQKRGWKMKKQIEVKTS